MRLVATAVKCMEKKQLVKGSLMVCVTKNAGNCMMLGFVLQVASVDQSTLERSLVTL